MFKHSKKEDLILLAQELGEDVTSTSTVIDLKRIIEESEAFKRDEEFVKQLLVSIIDERKIKVESDNKEREAKIELEKLKLEQIERQIELENIRNGSVRNLENSQSSNSEVEINIENLIRSIRTLSIPLPSKPENFNLFFQSLERAFATKNVPSELKAEILINLLGEKASTVLLYINEDEIRDYDKLKSIVLKQFEPTAQECLNNFRKAQRQSNESHIQFATRLTANFEYYCKLRNASDFKSVCNLIISDKLFETLDRDTASHISIKQSDGWLEPIELGKQCDLYFVSKGKSLKFTENRMNMLPTNEHKFQNKPFKHTAHEYRKNYPKQIVEKPNCYICRSPTHFAKFCPNRYRNASDSDNEKRGKQNQNSINRIGINSPVYKKFTNQLEHANIIIDGKETKVLIDSGAQITVVNSDIITSDKLLEGKVTLQSCFSEEREGNLARFKMSLNDSRPIEIIAAVVNKLNFKCIIPPNIYELLKNNVNQMSASGENIKNTAKCSQFKEQCLINDNNSDGEECVKKEFLNDDFLLNVSNVLNCMDIIDVSHIIDSSLRKSILTLVQSYVPNKVKTCDLKMSIVLNDDIPVFQRPRRLSFGENKAVEKQINEWLDNGIIKISYSNYASPVVLCKKKNGDVRLCIDYRKINKKMIKDRFPLPVMQDVLDKLEGGKVFTCLDLKNGFFHVEVDKESRKFTSFVTHNGQFEFTNVPFGICNSPALFQRYVYNIFRELINEGIVAIYLDDIVVPAEDEKQALERLTRVLKVASEYGLELNLKKCQFLKEKIDFLGHVIENGTIRPSDEKTKAVKNFPTLKNAKQVQSFLGLTGFFRKYIQGYSLIAKPLSDLLRNETHFYFGIEQQKAFRLLKDCLTSHPVLHIFRQDAKLELHTDASKFGYGAILLQEDDNGRLCPIHYMSKKTTIQEEKYSSYELEVLAIIVALRKFRNYLLGSKFKIVTDCAAFQKTMGKKELTPKIARWALFLEEFEYEIVHRPGKQMTHVDALSRYPITSITCTYNDEMTNKIKASQLNDEYINTIKKLLGNGKINDYTLKNNVLFKIEDGKDLLVVPQAMQIEIIKKVHEIGHFAVAKTENVLKQDYYFPNRRSCVEKVISNCIECILINKKRGKAEGFLNPIPKEDVPLSTYHIDFIGPLPSTNKKYNHIFTVVDAFTKFVWFYPVKSTSSQNAIEKLKQQQAVFGNPSRIITDKGAAFTSKEFKDFCTEEGIEHYSITAGIPRGNGQVERIQGTLIHVLAKLTIEDPTKWFKFVDSVQRTINSTTSRSTKRTPFELLTGVKMRNKEEIKILEALEEEYVNSLMKNREDAREEAKQNIMKIQEENRKSYNKKRKKAMAYKEGDLVAIQRTQFGTGLKLRPKFHGPYEIVEVKPHDRYKVRKVGQHEGPNLTSTAADHMKIWGAETF